MTGPTLGQVIPYRYVWSYEWAAGTTEGRKDRPCVVTVLRAHQSGSVLVWVSPITHRTPDTPEGAIELPRRTKRRLELDEERSWIIATELNRFAWPDSTSGAPLTVVTSSVSCCGRCSWLCRNGSTGGAVKGGLFKSDATADAAEGASGGTLRFNR